MIKYRHEARKIIIKAHEKGYKTAEIADIFDVDVSSINKLLRHYKETGSYEQRTHERGRKAALKDNDIKNISALIDENPDVKINEIIEKLNLKLKNEAVRKTGYEYKKKTLHASEHERSRCGKSAKRMDK